MIIKPRDIKRRWIRFLVIGFLFPFFSLVILILECVLLLIHGVNGFIFEVKSNNHRIKNLFNGTYAKQVWKAMIRK